MRSIPSIFLKYVATGGGSSSAQSDPLSILLLTSVELNVSR